MVRQGIDYSGPRPTVEALRAAGRDFVLRYISSPGGLPKDITRVEADYWRAHGIDVGVVFEDSAGRALTGGHAGGVADARVALASVKAAGGPPDGGVVYVAVDVDVDTMPDLARVLDYLRGWHALFPATRLGIYGEYSVVRYALNERVVTYGWQTYAWSGGRWDERAQLRQYRNGQLLGGVRVDYCSAHADRWGQWPRAAGPRRRTPDPVQIAGTMPALVYGDRDPVPFKGGNYVQRLQKLLSERAHPVPADGIYGPATSAAVAAMNARLLDRKVDGRTVDAATWERLVGCQG